MKYLFLKLFGLTKRHLRKPDIRLYIVAVFMGLTFLIAFSSTTHATHSLLDKSVTETATLRLLTQRISDQKVLVPFSAQEPFASQFLLLVQKAQATDPEILRCLEGWRVKKLKVTLKSINESYVDDCFLA